jgi:hypothetical protein
MRGPLELIRHAHGHFESDDDTDRRIALIGFDNAIEVCIDVYIRLHPKLRKGVEIRREEVDAASKNYHTKLEFLDKRLWSAPNSPAVPIETILWYHQLRNELYHSGNGMVPERHVVEGAFEAALAVFATLFGTDPSPLVRKRRPTRPPRAIIPTSTLHTDEMEFLRAFTEFEQALVELLGSRDSEAGSTSVSVPEMWRAVASTDDSLKMMTERVAAIFHTRNKVVHQNTADISPDELVDAFVLLIDVTTILKGKFSARAARS